MGRRSVFEPRMYVAAYRLARGGAKNSAIAAALGIPKDTLKNWRAARPALDEAIQEGRAEARGKGAAGGDTFQDYMLSHLSDENRKLWDEILASEDLENGIERVEALLAQQGVRARQQLFVYALFHTNFNANAACRLLNVSYARYRGWVKNDPRFAELLDEIQWHKKNFFEAAFVQCVAKGEVPAVLHAVRTQCRDRGYGDKMSVEHSGRVDQKHEHVHTIRVDELPLDPSTRRGVLDALRAYREEHGLMPAYDTTAIPTPRPSLQESSHAR